MSKEERIREMTTDQPTIAPAKRRIDRLHDVDCDFAESALRIIERVALFDEIRTTTT